MVLRYFHAFKILFFYFFHRIVQITYILHSNNHAYRRQWAIHLTIKEIKYHIKQSNTSNHLHTPLGTRRARSPLWQILLFLKIKKILMSVKLIDNSKSNFQYLIPNSIKTSKLPNQNKTTLEIRIIILSQERKI